MFLVVEPFKNKFNSESIRELSLSIQSLNANFDAQTFFELACQNLEGLEMKDRAIQISNALEQTLVGSTKEIAKELKSFMRKTSLSGFIFWPISIYIERNYRDDFKTAMDLLLELTKIFTSEFGIRPFFEQYPDKTYSYLHNKLNDKDENVRRWISEGTRPNLPWGMNISHQHLNLNRNILLIENLKDDSSLYVRKSVANHMSDISMIDSKLALNYLKEWNLAGSDNQKWIVKQALRNLVKKGNKDALAILGYSQSFKIKVENVSVAPKRIIDGDFTKLKFKITSLKKQNLMIDYIIGYPKKNGNVRKKVFKMKALNAMKNEIYSIEKNISFKKVTTRVHYPGIHTCEVQVNGKIISKTFFTLSE